MDTELEELSDGKLEDLLGDERERKKNESDEVDEESNKEPEVDGNLNDSDQGSINCDIYIPDEEEIDLELVDESGESMARRSGRVTQPPERFNPASVISYAQVVSRKLMQKPAFEKKSGKLEPLMRKKGKVCGLRPGSSLIGIGLSEKSKMSQKETRKRQKMIKI